MADPVSVLPARARMSGSSLTGTEEGRTFFGQRLSVLGLCILALSGGFQLVQSVLYIVIFWENVPMLTRGVLGSAALFQLGATATAGLLWWLTRRRSLRGSWLPRLDVGATVLMCGFFQASAAMESEIGTALLLMVLTTLCALGTRAIVVPSGVRRTLALSVVCTAPIVVLTVVLVYRAGGSPGSVVGSAINGVMWAIVLITISTVASRTIFDLRREVGQARVLGQYTLEEKIGAGGMGEVWRASHAMLRRPTAIKLLLVERTGEASLQRFEREVQLTARLTHPNTVSIFEYGRAIDGVFYFAMELLDGVDLERLVSEHGPLPPERVVHVLRQVCGALAEAHGMGVGPPRREAGQRHLDGARR
jgi:serine/threonine-protein kinase